MTPLLFTKGLARVKIYEIENRRKENGDPYLVYTVAWRVQRGRRARKTFVAKKRAVAFARRKLKELAHGITIEVPAREWAEYKKQKSRLNGTPLQLPIDLFLSMRGAISPHSITGTPPKLLRLLA